eukprot:7826073-Pyramimonas_sp.AAC.1
MRERAERRAGGAGGDSSASFKTGTQPRRVGNTSALHGIGRSAPRGSWPNTTAARMGCFWMPPLT